ncbi:uncharacterized protein P884DRAFT_211568 [Thermothelomyces heterothallicus CBS 202.75]|uniref:uncharacterized protein n=1 Tax=Thermothelomyces heterothallicus CBS 202.75 TaxID=1149848 RepID=UPI003744117C
MAPIRRYLRITKYSVLECRIYLDNPALAQSWLLNPRDPVLPKVIESVRPLVLPKLREEQERERSRKKNKKRSIKDVVVQDDFEVSIFLTETDTRHSLLYKRKLFRDKIQTRLTSNSSKLMSASRDVPIDVEDQLPQGAAAVPNLRQEEDDQDAIDLADIPLANEAAADVEVTTRRPKRRRRRGGAGEGTREGSDASDGEMVVVGDSDYSADELPEGNRESEESAYDEDDDSAADRRPPKRRKEKAAALGGDTAERDDKKKLAMDISYEGFAIYGRVLCLVVKRRGNGAAKGGTSAVSSGNRALPSRPGGQAMMENWIASTQAPDAAAEEDTDTL